MGYRLPSKEWSREISIVQLSKLGALTVFKRWVFGCRNRKGCSAADDLGDDV
jgi:hypothetical protein